LDRGKAKGRKIYVARTPRVGACSASGMGHRTGAMLERAGGPGD
jgi:hypothetical protein